MKNIEQGGIEQDKLLRQDLEEARGTEHGVKRDQVISLIAIAAAQQHQLDLALEAISEVSTEKKAALYQQLSEMAPGSVEWQKQIEETRKKTR